MSHTLVEAQPTGYQEYYVLGYEEQVWRAFLAIYDGSDSDIPGNICSTVSLVATANYQVIRYDHWEDGYEADLLYPVQGSTLVFGDGDLSNGGTGDDILRAGDALNLTSDRDTGNPENRYVPVAGGRNSQDVRYDGGDRVISSGGPVNLSHAMWPFNGSWVGGAWQVYSRRSYKDTYSYRLPIGQDLYQFDSSRYGDFRDVYLQLQAFEDNSTISVDNGSEVLNLVLDRGQTYSSMGYIGSVAHAAIDIRVGTFIHSNKPVQVGLITGSTSPSGGFQGRFMIVLPDQLWGAEYIVPVPSGDADDLSEIYLFNPNDFEITIHAYDRFATTTFAISPTSYISSTMPYSTTRGGYVPADSAARFTSPDGAFGVVVCSDTANTTFEWGFSGIPAKYLTRDYYVPWAPGNYYCPGISCTDYLNGSPVWVTPLSDDTTFYVDFNQNGLDGVVDQTFTLDVLEQRRIFDPDNDNTGMHVWATAAFAIAWGEDPRTAGGSTPYLDMGVVLLPLREQWLDPVLTLDKAASPNVLPSSGGTVTFTLLARSYDTILSQIDVSDTLPARWSYVPGSTHITYPGGGTASPDPTIDGSSLFWNLSADLDIDQRITLTFQAQITDTGGINSPAFDGFETNTYDGGYGWAGNWHEVGDDGLPQSGGIVITDTMPYAGAVNLLVSGANVSISRTVDLHQFILPTLNLVRRIDSLEIGDYFYLDVYDGIQWTPVMTWTNGNQEGYDVEESIDLEPYVSATTAIRFRSNDVASNDDLLYIDQIKISDAIAVSINRGMAIGLHDYSGAYFKPVDEAAVYLGSLDLHKQVSMAEAKVGSTLVYTLSYANVSAGTINTNVILYDVLPVEHVTLLAASNGGVYDGASSTISWALGVLAPGASGSVTFSVKIKEFVQDGIAIQNVAQISSDQTGKTGSNIVYTLVKAANLRFTKTAPTISAPDQIITYTLVYENIGHAEATGVSIYDNIPISTTYVVDSLAILTDTVWISLSDDLDGDQGVFVSPTLVISPGIAPGIIGVGESGQIRFSVRIGSDVSFDKIIVNWATLYRDLAKPRDSTLSITRISDLALSKTAQQDIVSPGGIISFTLLCQNISQVGSQNQVYVLDAIPSYTHLITDSVYGNYVEYSWDNGATFSTTLPISPVTHLRWYTDALPVGASLSVGFAVRVQDLLLPNTTIRNTGRVSSTEIAATIGQWLPSDEVVVETIDLAIDKTATPAPVRPGESITFTLVYGNKGSADALGTVIVDQVNADDWIASPTQFSRTVDLLANSPSAYLEFTATVAPTATCGQAITDVAYISHLYDAASSLPVVVTVTAPYTAAFTPSVAEVCPLQPITFTNTSQGAANYLWDMGDGTITDTASPVYAYSIPGIYTVVLTAATVCGVDTVSDVITVPGPPVATFTISPTEQNVGIPVTFTNTSTGAVVYWWELGDGTVTNTVSPVHIYELPGTFNVTLTVTSTCGYTDMITGSVIVYPPTLAVSKQASPSPVGAGSVLSYTIVIYNGSAGFLTGVIVSDSVPMYTSFVPGSIQLDPSGAGTIGAGPPELAKELVVGPGQQVTVTWAVVVDAVLPAGIDTLPNTVRVSSWQEVTATGFITTLVVAVPNLTISKASAPSVQLGQVLTYTIVVSNEGSQGAAGVVVTDSLPLNTRLAFISDEGRETSPGSGVVTWTLGAVDVGDLITRTVVVSMAENLSARVDVLTNVVSLQDDGANGSDLAQIDNVYTLTTPIEYVPVLSIVKTGPATAQVGDRVVFTFTVTHNLLAGDSTPLTNLAVDDDYAGQARFAGGDDGDGLLEQGESWVYTATYTVRHTDPTPLINQGTVQGRDWDDDLVTATATHSTNIQYAPVLNVIKEGPATAIVSETILFTFRVSNIAFVPTEVGAATGDGSPIRSIQVSDDYAGVATFVQGDDGDAVLELGEVWIYTVSYFVRASDPNPLVNTVTVLGVTGNGLAVRGTATHSMVITGQLVYQWLFLPLIFKND